MASPDPLSPTPSTSSTMKASKNTEQETEPADQEDIQMEYSSDWFEQPKYRRSNKTLPIRT
jgi:protoheme ferro-lyase